MSAAPISTHEDQFSSRPQRAKRTRWSLDLLAAPPVNDDTAQRPQMNEPERAHGPRLDQMIREIVRSEVRAEFVRVMAMTPTRPTHVSVAEYAATRSISVSTVRSAIRGGRLPAIRIGAAVRVPVDAEIGRPVSANANGHDTNPVSRAEQILAGRNARSLVKPTAQRVA
jgi:hypothetical protein